MPKHSSVKVARGEQGKYRARLKKVKNPIKKEILQELEAVFIHLSQGQDELKLFSEHVGKTKGLSEKTLLDYLDYISKLSHFVTSSRSTLLSILSGASEEETETSK